MIYPIGIQNFESLRNDGYVYVDKTEHIYRLVTTGRYYFLSRPRRFGKSLLISTMDAYFSGKKELFKGLALERLEKKWTKHPILHLDLNSRKYEEASDLESELNKHLESWEKLYGDEYKDRAVEERFYRIIEQAYERTGERVVILVDEYDKPVLQAIGNDRLQNSFRNTLKAFYSVLKTQDRYIQFAFLTGVTKFGKVSLGSEVNNLQDISMDKSYADLCGISVNELHAYYGNDIQELATSLDLTFEATCSLLKKSIGGYHFEYECIEMYNPFWLLTVFNNRSFEIPNFENDLPSYLEYLLRKSKYSFPILEQEETQGELVTDSIDLMSCTTINLLYHLGYLTIKDYDKTFDFYSLGFPNERAKHMLSLPWTNGNFTRLE